MTIPDPNYPSKIIVTCEQCSQKMYLPANKHVYATCPKCGVVFEYPRQDSVKQLNLYYADCPHCGYHYGKRRTPFSLRCPSCRSEVSVNDDIHFCFPVKEPNPIIPSVCLLLLFGGLVLFLTEIWLALVELIIAAFIFSRYKNAEQVYNHSHALHLSFLREHPELKDDIA